MNYQNGAKFEVWLELLLKRLNYQNVMRNVEYRRKDNSKREVDICYNIVKNKKIYLAVIEAKYTQQKTFRWKRKREKISQVISIDNLIDEVWERHLFIGADFSLIATNSRISNNLRKKIKNKPIRILDGTNLLNMYRDIGGKFNLETSIAKIQVENYKQKRNIIYI